MIYTMEILNVYQNCDIVLKNMLSEIVFKTIERRCLYVWLQGDSIYQWYIAGKS